VEVLPSFRFAQSALQLERAVRTLAAALALLALMWLSAPAARAADPDFTVDPPSPLAGQQAMFTPANAEGAAIEWEYGSGTGFVTENTHVFDVAGEYLVTMTVDGTPYSKTVDVRPVAAFHRDPGDAVVLETGQPATSTSDSSPGAALSWEIDGVALGGAESVEHSFSSPGTHVVRLEVVHNDQRNLAVSVLRVNAPPAAGFVWTPSDAVAGGEVRLYSTSVDAEGPLGGEAWELDGDGDFNDAFGPSAASAFAAGNHDVSLRVTDGDGVSRTVTRTIAVAAAPVVILPPSLMSPFPTVRLVGVVLRRGARIGLVEVRGAPRGASVTVRCSGGGCPFRSRRRVAETGRVRLSPVARFLRAGARVEILVRAPRVIGKYVGFRIRAGKRPVRVDRCLVPGSTEPRRCT